MATIAENQEINIVEEYKIGNTTIKICDAAYKDKTPDDINRILARIVQIGWKSFNTASYEGKKSES